MSLIAQYKDFLLKYEDGFTSVPDQRSFMGISQEIYDSYRANKNVESQDVKKMSYQELKGIIRTQYWDIIKGDSLPLGIDYSMLDFAFISGPEVAIKTIQKILDLKEDGVMGNVTLWAIKRFEDKERLITDLNMERLFWMKTLRDWPKYGKGWESRILGDSVSDTGVLNRSISIMNMEPIPHFEVLTKIGSVKTEESKIKRTVEFKKGVNFDNIAKFSAGSIPAWMTASASVPAGPLQWAFAFGTVVTFLIVAFWVFTQLK